MIAFRTRESNTRISFRGRDLDLTGADPGPITVTLEFGTRVLDATASLRPAGSRLLFP